MAPTSRNRGGTEPPEGVATEGVATEGVATRLLEGLEALAPSNPLPEGSRGAPAL